MRGITVARVLIAITVLLTLFADLVVWRGTNIVVFFTIPLAIAALWASAADVVVTAIIVLLLDAVDIVIADPVLNHVPFTMGALLVVSYLSYQLALEKQVAAQRTANAEAARHQLQQFLGMISHDLRSPLTAVYGYAQVLQLHLDQGDLEVSRKNARSIRDAAQRMQRLVDDLLVAARLGEGHFEIQLAPMDLAACLRGIVTDQQSNASNHRLIVDAPANLLITADRARIDQAVTNLVSNAIKFSPDGSQVVVRLTCSNETARLAVTDRGPGIPADQIPYLFQPFSRLNRDRSTTGTGLGLFITKGIVDSHGGHIWVESARGQGSTFFVTLPLQTEASSAADPHARGVSEETSSQSAPNPAVH